MTVSKRRRWPEADKAAFSSCCAASSTLGPAGGARLPLWLNWHNIPDLGTHCNGTHLVLRASRPCHPASDTSTPCLVLQLCPVHDPNLRAHRCTVLVLIIIVESSCPFSADYALHFRRARCLAVLSFHRLSPRQRDDFGTTLLHVLDKSIYARFRAPSPPALPANRAMAFLAALCWQKALL
ncbi:hypothetical protein FA95DRAFT_708909 [Auriscalpium vulgare]|uniref:Uncharacterized protein n=1 Tax=Auriscalpium vulgare TaxID=40419 RepID=A0ACB8RCP6_9AGAM|nr:hypothetical protein FA95DRAFT_708909 [Auriscalpium vulgare]